ncbi:MAG: glycosyltransferase family 4 protein [Anaerolineae bacterium]
MRVCLDLSPAVHLRGGIGRYAHELASALPAAAGELDLCAFYNDARHACDLGFLSGWERIASAQGNKAWRLAVLLAHLARRPQDGRFSGVDLFHATDNVLPWLARTRSVFTLHDLAFRLYPETHSGPNRAFLELMMPRFLRRADAVIADSEATRQDATSLYGVAPERISVVYPGVHPRFRPVERAEVDALRQRYGLPARYLLFVGTLEPRKNLPALLKAYRALLQDGVRVGLVLVGKLGWRTEAYQASLRALAPEDLVVTPGYVPDDELPALYTGAELLAFPSLYEGFGFPVLEAMACGTPVVCANVSSLPEVVGDAAIQVDPHDIAALSAALRRVLEDVTLREALAQRGIERAATFTWERTVRETLAVYRRVLAAPHAMGES